MEDFLNRLKVISKKKKKGRGVLQIIFYILHLRNILSFVSILASVCMNRLKKTSLLFTCIHSKGVMLLRNCFVFFNKTLFIILSGYIYIDSKAMGNK